MSKDILTSAIRDIDASYSWVLYFFHIDRRSTNPFKVYKVRFKKDNYITDYANNTAQVILKWQVGNITNVQFYNGENTKVSCDKLSLEDSLVQKQWKLLQESIVDASDEKIKGKIMGYILEGQSSDSEIENRRSIMFLKVANPLIEMKNKRCAVFNASIDEELDLISSDMYQLSLTTDCILLNKIMYTFNPLFENVFNLEKTMKNVKNLAIGRIIAIDCFEDSLKFKNLANAYNSVRTFLTLNEGRLRKISTKSGRQWISGVLQIDLDKRSMFVNLDEKKVSAIIKYLCFKIFRDDESKDLLEVSNAIKFKR